MTLNELVFPSLTAVLPHATGLQVLLPQMLENVHGQAGITATKRLTGVAPETTKHASQGIHLSFETQGRCQQKFKQGYNCPPPPPQKCPLIFLKNPSIL